MITGKVINAGSNIANGKIFFAIAVLNKNLLSILPLISTLFQGFFASFLAANDD